MTELLELMIILEKRAEQLYRLYSSLFKNDSDVWLQIAQEEAEHMNYIANYFNADEYSFDKSNTADIKKSISFIESLIEEYSCNIPDMQQAYENAFIIENFAFEYHISRKIDSIKKKSAVTEDVFMELKESDNRHMVKIHNLLKNHYLNSKHNFKTLISIALIMEKIAKQIYLEFSLMFIENGEISNFFEIMAAQEEGHYTILKNITDKSDQSELEEEVEINHAVKSYFNMLEIFLSVIPEVKNLKEALEIAHEIENSEINTIFKIVVERYINIEDRKELLYRQIILHNQALIEFSSKMRKKNLLIK